MIPVLDFGAQYAQLIARRIREAGAFGMLVAPDTPIDELAALHPALLEQCPVRFPKSQPWQPSNRNRRMINSELTDVLNRVLHNSVKNR